MEGDVALDLLHHLVDMPVQHGDRAELFQIGQCLCAVGGAPAPVLVHRPQRHMCEQHDRRAGGQVRHILLQPFKLVVAQIAQPVALQVHDIDQADEMHPVVVEAVPAVTLACRLP